jgi:hypothetical protein
MPTYSERVSPHRLLIYSQIKYVYSEYQALVNIFCCTDPFAINGIDCMYQQYTTPALNLTYGTENLYIRTTLYFRCCLSFAQRLIALIIEYNWMDIKTRIHFLSIIININIKINHELDINNNSVIEVDRKLYNIFIPRCFEIFSSLLWCVLFAQIKAL